jgi:hypothetical protein
LVAGLLASRNGRVSVHEPPSIEAVRRRLAAELASTPTGDLPIQSDAGAHHGRYTGGPESTRRHRGGPVGPAPGDTSPEEIAMSTLSASTTDTGFELRFRSLFNEGRGLSFPCDARGQVDLDALSPRARINYLYARTVIGREFSLPAVARARLH